MSVPAALAARAVEIEAALDILLPLPDGQERRLMEAMRYAALGGGKRLRGYLVLETAALFGTHPGALRVAASVEMLHAYSLVHDDLPAMDDDEFRRGQPSTHMQFDEATAILAGDALQARAFELLAGPETHPDPAVRCALVLALGDASGAAGMAGGQMIDMATEGLALTEAEVMRLQALKTGRLIQYSVAAGGILGLAPAAHQAALLAYGADLGAAFQIADDVLDATGTTAGIGKTAGKDAAAGKATPVALLGLDGARARADALSARAIAHLAPLGPAADRLRDLARYVVDREH